MRAAIDAAREAGRKVAFTLSDNFVIDRHRADFVDLIDQGLIDILFSNEGEIQSLAQVEDFDKALGVFAAKVPVLVSTRSEKGAVAIVDGVRHEAPAAPVSQIIVTTADGCRGSGTRATSARRVSRRGVDGRPIPCNAPSSKETFQERSRAAAS